MNFFISFKIQVTFGRKNKYEKVTYMLFDNLIVSSYVDKSDSKLATILLSVIIPIAAIVILLVVLIKTKVFQKFKNKVQPAIINNTIVISVELNELKIK